MNDNHFIDRSAGSFSDLIVFLCVRPWVLVWHSRALTCVRAGVRAHPPVCVCHFLGSARELAGAEKSTSVTEETDIDAEDGSQTVATATATDELSLNRGVTDLDATAKTAEPNQPERKVRHWGAGHRKRDGQVDVRVVGEKKI